MANSTAGVANITIMFESKTAQGFGKFSDGVRDEAAALLQRLETAGIRGVSVVDSDVLIGQNFVLSGNGSVVSDDDDGEDADAGSDEAEEPQPAPKRRGRPPGSKNKPKVTEAASDADEDEAPRRSRKASGKKAAGKKAAGPRRRA